MSAQTAYFAHISDTHIGPTPDYERHGHNPYWCARRLVELLNGLPQRPDFIVHTGDVVTEPDPKSYRLAAQLFARLEAPIYYVVGNHDRARDIDHFLPMGPRQNLAPERDLLTYAFEVRGYRLLVVDARGPAGIDPQGLFSERQLQIVRQELSANGPPLVIFTHFPILPLNSVWMDKNMLTINGAAFHDIVKQDVRRLRGVFYGHVHQPMQTSRDGVLYISAVSAFSQFAAWPSDVEVQLDPEHLPGFGFVHLMPEQMIVHQHTFPRPAGPPAAVRGQALK
jgi:3',5'-cyclic AMP phosphodiesterase CpdA